MTGSLEYIFVDLVNGTPGGTGSATDPIDTMANAHARAVATDIRRLFLVNDGFHTLPALDWTDFEFWGAGRSFGGGPVLDLNGQSVEGSVVHRMTVFGDGATKAYTIRNGTMALTSNAQIYAFESVVTLTNSTRGGMRLVRCTFGEDGTSQAAIFDFVNHDSGATREVTLGPVSGKIVIRNMVLANLQVEIAGDVEVDIESSCTMGNIILRGTGKITNNSGGTTIDASGFVEADAAQDGFVYVDDANGSALGTGSSKDPVDSMSAAHPICIARGSRRIKVVQGFHALPAVLDWTFFEFEGVNRRGANGATAGSINMSARDCNGCVFKDLTLSSDAGGGRLTAVRCLAVLISNFQQLDLEECKVSFGVTPGNTTAIINMKDCTLEFGLYIDYAGVTGTTINFFGGCFGQVEIRNLTAAKTMQFDGSQKVTIAATCTAGDFKFSGAGAFDNQATGPTIDDSALVQPDLSARPRFGAIQDSDTSFSVNVWIERNGQILTPTNASLVAYEDGNATPVFSTPSPVTPDASGQVILPVTGLTFPSGVQKRFSFRFTVTDDQGIARTGGGAIAVKAA